MENDKHKKIKLLEANKDFRRKKDKIEAVIIEWDNLNIKQEDFYENSTKV